MNPSCSSNCPPLIPTHASWASLSSWLWLGNHSVQPRGQRRGRPDKASQTSRPWCCTQWTWERKEKLQSTFENLPLYIWETLSVTLWASLYLLVALCLVPHPVAVVSRRALVYWRCGRSPEPPPVLLLPPPSSTATSSLRGLRLLADVRLPGLDQLCQVVVLGAYPGAGRRHSATKTCASATRTCERH